MKVHPIAEPFPPMDADQLRDLAEDIKAQGLEEPIITFEDKILDGRNRFEACKIAGVELQFEEYDGDDPLGYVVSHNLRRRHLSIAMRAEIAAKIATMRVGRPENRSNDRIIPTQAEAAKVMGVSESSVRRAKAKLADSKKPASSMRTSGWTVDEVKRDQPLFDALTEIAEVYGKNDTMEIRKGTIGLSKADIIALSKLAKSQMLAIQDLIMANHWTPKKALKFLTKKPDGRTTVEQLHNYCLGTPDKKWKAIIGGFTHTVEANIK